MKDISFTVTKSMIAVGVVMLIVGFAAGYEYKAYEIRKAISKTFSDTEFNADTKKGIGDGKDGKETTYHKPGEDISFSTMKMKFSSAWSTKVLTSEYGDPWEARPGTKFVVVDHTVTNTGNSPYMYKELELYDKDGKRYTASGDAIGKTDNYLNVRDLAPDIPEAGILVYIVPEGAVQFEFGGFNMRTDRIDAVKFTVE